MDVLKQFIEIYLTALITLYFQIQDLVIKSIVSLQVTSISELLQSSSVIGSALQQPETVSTKSLVSES